MAATVGVVGSAGSGCLAFAHSARTFPGVSWPSSVVRSIIEIAVSIAHCLAVVLIDLLASMAARASAPTRSTPGSPCRNSRREEPVMVGALMRLLPSCCDHRRRAAGLGPPRPAPDFPQVTGWGRRVRLEVNLACG